MRQDEDNTIVMLMSNGGEGNQNKNKGDGMDRQEKTVIEVCSPLYLLGESISL